MAVVETEEATRRSASSAALRHEYARTIARDVKRTFHGNSRVDDVRLQIADVLRSYAQRDPELGYTQGMCFAAAIVCLHNDDAAEGDATGAFETLMGSLRRLWLPGFPWVFGGVPILQELLADRDPELANHLAVLDLDLTVVAAGAWVSVFARWLPMEVLGEVLPFLSKEGLTGFLAVTLMMLLYHRERLLHLHCPQEALAYLTDLSSEAPPEGLLDMCAVAVPKIRADANRAMDSLTFSRELPFDLGQLLFCSGEFIWSSVRRSRVKDHCSLACW